MADAKYKCPQCEEWISRRCTYYEGKYDHKCYKCGSKNKIVVDGSYAFSPHVKSATKKDSP